MWNVEKREGSNRFEGGVNGRHCVLEDVAVVVRVKPRHRHYHRHTTATAVSPFAIISSRLVVAAAVAITALNATRFPKQGRYDAATTAARQDREARSRHRRAHRPQR